MTVQQRVRRALPRCLKQRLSALAFGAASLLVFAAVLTGHEDQRQEADKLGKLHPLAREALSVLPADTEAVLCVNEEFRLEKVDDDRGADAEVDFAVDLSLFDKAGLLRGRVVGCAVFGSRRFRPPHDLGPLRHEGCWIVCLAEDFGDSANQITESLAEGAGKAIEVKGVRLAQFSKEIERDQWTFYVGIPRERLLLVGTDRDYVESVIAGLQKPDAPQFRLTDLPEWKHVDAGFRGCLAR